MPLPKPVASAPADGEFVLDGDTALVHDEAGAGVAAWLRSVLTPPTGVHFTGTGKAIELRLTDGLAAEGYRLTVDSGRVLIEASGDAGLFYGAQTLRQLLPPAAYRRALMPGVRWAIPATRIVDEPRFAWRGCLLDVARRFVPKHDLLRFIDLVAAHKLNVLHLHLSDDQGWRVEIRRYPKLTEVGGWRRESPVGDRRAGRHDGRPHGGFYTQDDIREIVAYAAERFVTVVPEIDVPGHTGAAIAAYPELGGAVAEVPTNWGIMENVLNVEESTIRFFQDVFDEVLELFPGEYVCVGGDECPKKQWREDPRAQRRIAELGLRDEDALQSWFTGRFDTYLASKGRRLLGWDEILEGGLAPGATVASWRGTEGGVAAARAGHDVVMCPDHTVYFDYRQSESLDEPIPVGTVTTLADVYGFEPVPPGLDASQGAHVLGAQCNVWTEHMDSARVIDYMVFPRLCAFAETVWSPRERDFAEFSDRLDAHLERLDAYGVEYRRPAGPLPWQARPDARGFPR